MQPTVYTALTKKSAVSPETFFAPQAAVELTEIEKLEKALHHATSQLRSLYHAKNTDIAKQKGAEKLVEQLMLEIKQKTPVNENSNDVKSALLKKG